MTDFPFKFGKLPAKPLPKEAKKFSLANFLPERKWPSIPVSFGEHKRVRDWEMLGNDKYGCCVWSGAAHEHMMLTMIGDIPDATFTAADVLSDYAAATGFDPNNPDTDQGTDMQAAAEYRRTKGIVDSQGKRHKILAWLPLKKGDPDQLAVASYLFGGAVGVGLWFTDKAAQQFDDFLPWSVVPRAKGEGGHYVPGTARNSKGSFLTVTWGRLHAMTPHYYEKYSDEAIVYLTDEFLVDGRTPQGYELPELRKFLQSLGR